MVGTTLILTSYTMDDNYFGSVLGDKSGIPKMVEASDSPPTKKSRKGKPHEKILAASCSAEIAMDQSIWKEFPEDLLEAMIARLPIATFFCFRSVCQKWNSLSSSPILSQHFAEVGRTQIPWFYTLTYRNYKCGAMYDPTLEKWLHPAAPYLPFKTIFIPVSSAGGLVCFLDSGCKNMFVCNPLTPSFKELPPRSLHIWSRVAIGMVQCGSTGYKIVWLGSNGDHEIYESVKNRWSCPGTISPGIKLPLSLNSGSHAVSIGSTVYFMRGDPDGILSFDADAGVWKQLVVPLPPHLKDHMLAESGGRLMLVGLLSKNAATCVGIWELQKMTLLWKEMDRMPNEWCLEFYGKQVWMKCIGNRGGLLMVSLKSTRMQRLVSYDVGKRKWGKVMDCVLPRCGGRRQWIACGTAFLPCPTAVP